MSAFADFFPQVTLEFLGSDFLVIRRDPDHGSLAPDTLGSDTPPAEIPSVFKDVGGPLFSPLVAD